MDDHVNNKIAALKKTVFVLCSLANGALKHGRAPAEITSKTLLGLASDLDAYFLDGYSIDDAAAHACAMLSTEMAAIERVDDARVFGDAGELSRLLRIHWDPIGCGVPSDEYDGYAHDVMNVLLSATGRDFAVADVASLLFKIRREKMLLPDPAIDGDVLAAIKIVNWWNDGTTG